MPRAVPPTVSSGARTDRCTSSGRAAAADAAAISDGWRHARREGSGGGPLPVSAPSSSSGCTTWRLQVVYAPVIAPDKGFRSAWCRPTPTIDVVTGADPTLGPPAEGDTWTGLSSDPLPVESAASWAVLSSCGGVVTFSGTARDHSVGRADVTRLEYEAYEEQVVPRLDEIAAAARDRWPDLGRIALIHRIGVVPITESAVVVAVSAPHRDHAFEAARFCIDTLKQTVPIWKREDWSEGSSWGLEPQHITDVPRS